MSMRDEFGDAARRLFGDLVTSRLLEEAESGEFPHALWDAMSDSGFGLVLVPEGQGGLGAGLQEAAAILQAAGEHAAPGPMLELLLGNQLLALAGRSPTSAPLVVAFLEGREPDGEPLILRNVPWARAAEQVLVVARSSAGLLLAVVPGAMTEMHTEISDAAGEPLATVKLPAHIEWTSLHQLDWEACLRRAALLRSAQMTGAMRWCLDRSKAYTQERKQFGREIGKFQVVQQMMAEMASAVVATSAIVDAAMTEPDNAVLVAAARSRIADATDTVFALAHQVHGAIGFSYEYVLHHRTRRLMAWRDQFGTSAYWRRVLAQSFAGKRADEIWPVMAG